MTQALAESGALSIALLDLKQELGESAASELSSSAKIPVKFYKADVTDAEASSKAIDEVVATFGSVDILINSAGIVKYVSVFSPDTITIILSGERIELTCGITV